MWYIFHCDLLLTKAEKAAEKAHTQQAHTHNTRPTAKNSSIDGVSQVLMDQAATGLVYEALFAKNPKLTQVDF